MNSNQAGVLCAGSLVYDILVKPFNDLRFGTTTFVESIEYRVGGNAANTSRALAKLGVPVRIFGAVGSDANGDFVLDELKHSGVDTDGVIRVSKPTATSIALIGSAGERQFLHRLGVSEDVFADPLAFTDAVCKGSSHFHLASLFVVPHLRKNGAKMLADAKAAGLSTSFDTNWDPQGEWIRAIDSCLPNVDIFFMNEDEARMLTGLRETDTAARTLIARGVKLVVIKLGHRGCAIYGDEEIICPGFVVDTIDTTGAGDCFVAGFLAARQQNLPVREVGQFANAVGALSVQKIGAVEGVTTQDRVLQWMSQRSDSVRG
jgi:sugar/nucleoside kinase (ribokinase family)